MWDWLDEAVNEVSGWVTDGWETVNDLVDTYIWDADSDEAIFEAWVRDTFNVPDKEGESFINEAVEVIADALDSGLDEAESLLKDATGWYDELFEDVEQAAVNLVDEAKKTVTDYVETVKIDAASGGGGAAAGVYNYVTEVVNKAGDIINNISLVLGIGFDLAMATIIELPALIMDLKADLAGWFDIDVEKLIAGWQEAQKKMIPDKET